MDLVTVLAQAAAEETDKDSTGFYIAGILLVLFAVGVGIAGIRRPEWEEGPARAVMLVGAVLVAAAMVTAIVTT